MPIAEVKTHGNPSIGLNKTAMLYIERYDKMDSAATVICCDCYDKVNCPICPVHIQLGMAKKQNDAALQVAYLSYVNSWVAEVTEANGNFEDGGPMSFTMWELSMLELL